MLNDNYPFDPFFLLKSSLSQTFMGWLLNVPAVTNAKTKIITLSDNDRLALEVTTPKRWIEYDPTVVMVHGLCGSHKSAALMRMAKRLEDRNIRAIRLNLRGCGSGRGLSKKTYHSGEIDDVLEAIKILKKETPNSNITLIGFSLGGNISLKLAGDLKDEAKEYLSKVIALSPPIDFHSSIKKFNRPQNKIYSKYFIKQLKSDVEYMKRKFIDFPRINFPKSMDIEEFNRLFVVPFFGFESLDHYYSAVSAKKVVSDIKIPSKILVSKDDPLVPWETFKDIDLPENLDVYITKKGGHIGYFGNPNSTKGFYWLDNQLMDWIEN